MHKLHRRGKLTTFLLTKLKNAILQNARQKMEIPVETEMPCVTRIRIPTGKSQKVAVLKVDGRRPLSLPSPLPLASSEGRLSL